jgi:predicted N-acyltransferase
MAMGDVSIRVLPSFHDVDARTWDALVDDADNPFVERAFLTLLEDSGSLGRAWRPRVVVASRGGSVVGAVPAFVRSDSFGEFIFDWQFADAAKRAGIAWYPKLTVAVPFTPATGPRLLVHPAHRGDDVVASALVQALLQIERDEQLSSTHVLFHPDRDGAVLERHGLVRRRGLQFHWHNDGYASFDDFLSRLDHAARKQIKRERRRVAESGLVIETRQGHEVPTAWWSRVYALYAGIYDRKWGRPYLTPAFFTGIGTALPERALVVVARDKNRPADEDIVAMTLSFEKGAHCYGRYWGSDVDVPGLHFELCYYTLQERAIARGKTLVEAGAQGEHKLKRGYLPSFIHSAHHVRDARFHAALGRFVAEEAAVVAEEREALAAHGPFRSGTAPLP